MFGWLAIIGTSIGMTAGTVFFSLWMVARQRIRTLELILEDERSRKRVVNPRTSDPFNMLEINRREHEVDEIRERWSNWNQDDDQTFS